MRYFTIRQGALVTRFGTGTYLGATVGVSDKGPNKGQTVLSWTEGEVVAIPEDEFGKYLREYNQLLREGSIAESTEEAWKAFHVKREEAVKAEAEMTSDKPADETPTNPLQVPPADEVSDAPLGEKLDTIFDDEADEVLVTAADVKDE